MNPSICGRCPHAVEKNDIKNKKTLKIAQILTPEVCTPPNIRQKKETSEHKKLTSCYSPK